MFAAEREIMLQPSTQYKLCVLQGLIVEQPVQFCSLCRGVAVLVLNGDAVKGKDSAILKPGFHPGWCPYCSGRKVVSS